VALLATLALASCSGAAGGERAVATTHVDLPRSYMFAPASIEVPVGSTVTWTNGDQFTHSVRLGRVGGNVVGVMKPGESVHARFDHPGTFPYDCSFHPQNMKGTVHVRP
jgi:plastocyanin